MRVIFISIVCAGLVVLAAAAFSGALQPPEEDTTAPFTWGHYPPRFASNVFPTTDISFFVTDTGSGPRLSTVWVRIDGSYAVTDYYQAASDLNTYLIVCPNLDGFDPGQVVEVSIDAGDWAGNFMSRDTYHLTICAAAPRVNVAGYMLTRLSSEGGKLTMVADVAAPLSGIGQIDAYLGLTRLDLDFRDDGTAPDVLPYDGIWMAQLNCGPGLVPGDVWLSLLAKDSFGFAGPAWPFVGVYWYPRPDPFPSFSVADSLRWRRFIDEYFASYGPPDGFRPVILAAGYWHTNIFKDGGNWVGVAIVTDPDGPDDIDRVGLFNWWGQPTGIWLNDEGLDGDVVPGDGIYMFSYPTPLGGDPAKRYLFCMVAFDNEGNASVPWPFIRIEQ